jgi:hypothetical protein
MVETVAPLLTPEDLATQLSTIEVLLSIYNGGTDLVGSKERSGEGGQGEDVILTTDNYNAIQNLIQFLSLPIESLGQAQSIALRDSFPAVIQMGIRLDPLRGTLDDDEAEQDSSYTKKNDRSLILDVGFAVRRLHTVTEGSLDDTLKPRWNLKYPNWLERTSYDALCKVGKTVEWEAEDSVGYLMNVIEVISEASLEYVAVSGSKTDTATAIATAANSIPNRDLVLRTWHLLPSLSMKDKRKDLVSYAIRYNFTGFVLAGKPGLVVLECPADESLSVDRYWSDIKTNSWSDLPPGHKKVSEKYREEGVKSCFVDMQEITGIEALGSNQVEEGVGRVKRNDLDKVKVWLQEHGCFGQFEIVLGKETQQ